MDQAALGWRALATTTSGVPQSLAHGATPTTGAFDRILTRIPAASSDGHDGDHAAKFLSASADDPPVNVIAEAKRIMKRAREADDSQRHDATKWRALAAAPGASGDIDHDCKRDVSDIERSVYESCDEGMEPPGVRGPGEASEL